MVGTCPCSFGFVFHGRLLIQALSNTNFPLRTFSWESWKCLEEKTTCPQNQRFSSPCPVINSQSSAKRKELCLRDDDMDMRKSLVSEVKRRDASLRVEVENRRNEEKRNLDLFLSSSTSNRKQARGLTSFKTRNKCSSRAMAVKNLSSF